MKKLLLTTTAVSFLAALPAASATIGTWNTGNVDVDPTSAPDVTGTSEVYDQTFVGTPPASATTSGTIVFTPEEAFSPGIKVVQESYTDTGPGIGDLPNLALDGCIMTSSEATCTSPFQSGKRVKQVITGFEPVDLVFNLADTGSSVETNYQVFGRLINQTEEPIEGFKVELGFGGAGAEFTLATADQLAFSTEFTAQPNNSGKTSSTQFPFGLFGDADDSPNFLLDGFFSDERTGLELTQTTNSLEAGSDDYFGEYANLFGLWNSQESVAEGLFWDADPDADALLMAWNTGETNEFGDIWEARRTYGETCNDDGSVCTDGVKLETSVTGTYLEALAAVNPDGLIDPLLLGTGAIEDLANLNLNYALQLGDLTGKSTFTIRTTAYAMPDIAPVPLPAGASLLLAALGMFGMLKRRNAVSG